MKILVIHVFCVFDPETRAFGVFATPAKPDQQPPPVWTSSPLFLHYTSANEVLFTLSIVYNIQFHEACLDLKMARDQLPDDVHSLESREEDDSPEGFTENGLDAIEDGCKLYPVFCIAKISLQVSLAFCAM